MYILAKIVKHSYINDHFIKIHDTPFQDYDRDKAMEIAKKEKYNVIYANSDFVANLGEPDKIKNDGTNGQDRKSYSDNQDRKNYYIYKDLTEETLEKNDDYWLEDFKKNYPIDWLEKENLDKRDNKE